MSGVVPFSQFIRDSSSVPDSGARDVTATPAPPQTNEIKSFDEFGVSPAAQVGVPRSTPMTRISNRFNNLYVMYKAGLGVASEEEMANLGRAMYTAETNHGKSMPIVWDNIKRVANGAVHMKWDDFNRTMSAPIDPGEFLAGIPESFQSLMTAPIEAATGIGLDQETFKGMKPEERARAIQETAGNIVMVAATGGTGRAVEGAFARSATKAIGEATTVAGAKAAAREVAAGAFSRRIVKGLAEAGVGGASQAAVANVGDEDMITKMIVQGIVFAPLGVAFETVRGVGNDAIGRRGFAQARDLNYARQLKVTGDESLAGVLAKVTAVESADNLAQAVVNGRLASKPNQPMVVPGVTDVGSIVQAIARGESKATPVFYERPNYTGDGPKTYDVLIGKDITNTQARSFAESGFAPRQRVSVNGRQFEFSSVSRNGQNINLRDPITGKSVTRPRGDVRIELDPLSHTAPSDVTTANFPDKVYKDFQEHLLEDNAKTSAAAGAEPILNWDETTPTKTFQEYLSDYARKRGYKPDEMLALEDIISKRLYIDGSENASWLSLPERDVLGKLQKQFYDLDHIDEYVKPLDRVKNAPRDIIKEAESNGMYVDDMDATQIVLRDAETNRVLHRAPSVREAREFINASGQADGIDLMGNGALPPRWGSGIMPIPEGPLRPNEVPYTVRANNWWNDILDTTATSLDWLTPNRSIMTSIDSRYGTSLFANVFDRTQKARLRANARIRPHYERLKQIESFGRELTAEERQVVGGYLETMSPAEVEARGGPGGRAMSPQETALARDLAKRNVDMSLAMRALRQEDKLAKEFDPSTPQYGQELKNLHAEMGVDDVHRDAINTIRTIRNSKDMSLGVITRRVDAELNGGMTRGDYMRHHGMDGMQLRMAVSLEKLYEDLATEFGIDKKHRLQNFQTHARVYDGGNISRTIQRDFKLPKDVAEFYASLTRTGEIDAYERDPIKAMQRYIKAGVDAQEMAPALLEAKKSIIEALKVIPNDARGKVEHMANRYLTDVQGAPGAAQKFTQQSVDELSNNLGLRNPIEVREQIVNGILMTGESAFQGFRIHAGVRDFYQGASFYFGRFGIERTQRMLAMGARGLDGITKRDLAAGGVIPELNTIFFATPTETTGSMLRSGAGVVAQGMKKIADVGLKMSGQKDIYALLHAGAYLDTWEMAGQKLTALARGELTKQKAYSDLKIDTYEPAVVKEFDRMVVANQFEEAARFLGRQTGAETIGVFGMGNNAGGWNRNIGRIAGQFGGWSMWFRSMANQQLSRGTWRNRLGFSTRIAMSQAAIAGASAALGLNLGSWYMPRGLTFMGGPLVDATEDVNDAVSGYGVEASMAQRRLRRFLPYDPVSEEFNIGQPYIMGSYFVNDLAKAYQLAQDGANPLQIGAQAGGFKVQPEE